MAIDFSVDDIVHQIAAKFVPAYLPDSRKPYYLKAAVQPEINTHGIASKADTYNVTTAPKVIEEGITAAEKIVAYLVADGYKVKTRLFTIWLRIRGEYDGTETHLDDPAKIEVRLQPTPEFTRFIQEKTKIEIIGKLDEGGAIAEAIDEATGLTSETVTPGRLLTIYGQGLKIDAEEDKKDLAGVFFVPETGVPIKVRDIAVNEPRTLKIVVPLELVEGKAYTLAIETQSSVKGGGTILKNIRDIKSGFSLTARK